MASIPVAKPSTARPALVAVAVWCEKRSARRADLPWLVGVNDRHAIITGNALRASVNAVSLTMMLGEASSELDVWFAPLVLALLCAIQHHKASGVVPEGDVR